jgi:hypothetical protein
MNRAKAFLLKYKGILAFLAALGFSLFLQGAIPFVSLPTMAQAVWSMGFSQSFANDSLLTIHSNYFGYPTPSAMSLGLPLAYPAGLFIRAGLHAADAYTLMAAIWLSLAFCGAFLFARLLGLKTLFSVLAAVLWMSMPVIWAHAAYSAVSLGIALIPLYLFLACKLFVYPAASLRTRVVLFLAYAGTCIIALFMDGYSFMMFAVGASVIGVYALVRFKELRRYIGKTALLVHVVGFGIAVVLYVTYIGGSLYEEAPTDFFRGWGLDLSFLAIPTRGLQWFWDTLHLSIPRSDEQFFGDESVWITTFSLPLIIAGLVCWWRMKSRSKLSTVFLILAAIGLYMALGPSIKINSTKPGLMGPGMPVDLELVPTGNALLSMYLPGFNIMRAAYRWSALMVFSLWALLVFQMSVLRSRRNELIMAAIVLFLVVSNLPHLQDTWETAVHNRNSFFDIDKDLVAPLDHDLKKGEIVAFLPYRNDFLINYIAPKLGIRTYNVGGDKNQSAAHRNWPETMRQSRMGKVDRGFAEIVLTLLAQREADAVVLPYIDTLTSIFAYGWPPQAKYRDDQVPVIADLQASGLVTVQEREYYTVVRIAPDFMDELESGELEQRIAKAALAKDMYPFEAADPTIAFLRALKSGWYNMEDNHVWSSGEAQLYLPIPDECNTNDYFVKIFLSAYAASADRAVEVTVETEVNSTPISRRYTFKNTNEQAIFVPVSYKNDYQLIDIKISKASSPRDLNGKDDSRVLGVSLTRIELVKMEKAHYPLEAADPSMALLYALKSGWYDLESNHVWSKGEAQLYLPVPDEYKAEGFSAKMSLSVYGASTERQVEVIIETEVNSTSISHKYVFNNPNEQSILVPLSYNNDYQLVSIKIPGAISPMDLNGASDFRVLGVSLTRIEIVQNETESETPGQQSTSTVVTKDIYPLKVTNPSTALVNTLKSGWYDLEVDHVWSGGQAQLSLPVPGEVNTDSYFAQIFLSAYGASPAREVEVTIETEVNDTPTPRQYIFKSTQEQAILVPLSNKNDFQLVSIKIPGAISPRDLNGASDIRVLGVSLTKIELVNGEQPEKQGQ